MHVVGNYKMACSSSNNSNIRLKRRLCNCGITAARHTVKSNQNGNKGRVLVRNTAITSSLQMIMMTTRSSILHLVHL
ncbi:unnamed protein product [Camellia sinensis]